MHLGEQHSRDNIQMGKSKSNNLWCEETCDVCHGSGVVGDGTCDSCNGICAPSTWLGDGFCDDGSYEYNGNQIFFNCEELNNDEGDCDALGRTNQIRPLPNGRIYIK